MVIEGRRVFFSLFAVGRLRMCVEMKYTVFEKVDNEGRAVVRKLLEGCENMFNICYFNLQKTRVNFLLILLI